MYYQLNTNILIITLWILIPLAIKFLEIFLTGIFFPIPPCTKVVFAVSSLSFAALDPCNISVVLFEGDHASLIDYNFIFDVSNKVKKGLFLGDNMEWHQVNLITGSACDFIFPEDPISVLKFREIGYKSFFVPIECNEDIFKDYGQEKDIDVLIFGRLKTDREFYIDKLRESEINFKFVTPYLPESDSMLKLAKLINRSKITLALTKSANGTKYFNPLKNFKNFYQLKGRVFMTGLCKSLCISEYCPSYDLIYRNETIPVFKNKILMSF